MRFRALVPAVVRINALAVGPMAKALALVVAVTVAFLSVVGTGSVACADTVHEPEPKSQPGPGGDVETFLQDVTSVAHPPLSEISGIVRSRTYPGVWWVHNDSGDEPRLFAIDAQGHVVMPARLRNRYYAQEFEEGKEPWPGISMLNSAHVDWEDITIDDGRLYIADMGNNGNARRDLGFYIVNEPNPQATDRGARPISFIPVAYPDQESYPPEDWRFDCEAVFVSGGRLYLLTKHRAEGRVDRLTYGTNLYRLDTTHSDRENILTLVSAGGELPLVPTAADLSPDGKRLAVLSYDGVWMFEAPDASDDWLGGKAWRLAISPMRLRQAEGICWDDETTVRIVNEQRDLFTLDVKHLKPAP